VVPAAAAPGAAAAFFQGQSRAADGVDRNASIR
jgi:hypothetical protein